MHAVYTVHTELNPEFIYVGVTTDPHHRMIKHCSKSSKCLKLKRAIRKFGRETFKMTVVQEFIEPTSAYSFESELIIKLKQEGKRMYNMTRGGLGPSGRRVRKKTREKLSVALKKHNEKDTVSMV